MLLRTRQDENRNTTGIISAFTNRKLQRQNAEMELNKFNQQNSNDKKALEKYMLMINNGFDQQTALTMSMDKASEGAVRHAVEMGGASNTLPPFNEKQEETRKKLQETVESFSAASIKGKALNMVFQGLSMAGNMLIFAAISKGISMAATAIDNFIHRSELAQKKWKKPKITLNPSLLEWIPCNLKLTTTIRKLQS